MNLKSLRQIFKVCADDTRLRIVSLLEGKELTVKEICFILKANQPTISKHLSSLRLLKVVIDRRVGNLVYYSLNKDTKSPEGKIVSFILSHFHDVPVFKKDKEALRKGSKKK